MKVGMNLLLWTAHVTGEHMPLCEKLKAAGFDGVEVPVHDGDEAHYTALGRGLDAIGLKRTVTTVLPGAGADFISADPASRKAALDYMRGVIDRSAALGAEVVAGPFYQPLAHFSGEPPTEAERARAAEGHRAAAEHAAQAGILLAVEALNRFECYLLNTIADAAAHVARVGHPSLKCMYDTFHANIEEKDPLGVIKAHYGAIGHVHISENDRGTPGRGHAPLRETLRQFLAMGYQGWFTIEAFGRALPSVAAATRCWRDFSTSPEQVYSEGIALIRGASR
jgi:D-psicose/D-tagatose/L-ribulose 3-epimerase